MSDSSSDPAEQALALEDGDLPAKDGKLTEWQQKRRMETLAKTLMRDCREVSFIPGARAANELLARQLTARQDRARLSKLDRKDEESLKKQLFKMSYQKVASMRLD